MEEQLVEIPSEETEEEEEEQEEEEGDVDNLDDLFQSESNDGEEEGEPNDGEEEGRTDLNEEFMRRIVHEAPPLVLERVVALCHKYMMKNVLRSSCKLGNY